MASQLRASDHRTPSPQRHAASNTNTPLRKIIPGPNAFASMEEHEESGTHRMGIEHQLHNPHRHALDTAVPIKKQSTSHSNPVRSGFSRTIAAQRARKDEDPGVFDAMQQNVKLAPSPNPNQESTHRFAVEEKTEEKLIQLIKGSGPPPLDASSHIISRPPGLVPPFVVGTTTKTVRISEDSNKSHQSGHREEDEATSSIQKVAAIFTKMGLGGPILKPSPSANYKDPIKGATLPTDTPSKAAQFLGGKLGRSSSRKAPAPEVKDSSELEYSISRTLPKSKKNIAGELKPAIFAEEKARLRDLTEHIANESHEGHLRAFTLYNIDGDETPPLPPKKPTPDKKSGTKHKRTQLVPSENDVAGSPSKTSKTKPSYPDSSTVLQKNVSRYAEVMHSVEKDSLHGLLFDDGSNPDPPSPGYSLAVESGSVGSYTPSVYQNETAAPLLLSKPLPDTPDANTLSTLYPGPLHVTLEPKGVAQTRETRQAQSTISGSKESIQVYLDNALHHAKNANTGMEALRPVAFSLPNKPAVDSLPAVTYYPPMAQPIYETVVSGYPTPIWTPKDPRITMTMPIKEVHELLHRQDERVAVHFSALEAKLIAKLDWLFDTFYETVATRLEHHEQLSQREHQSTKDSIDGLTVHVDSSAAAVLGRMDESDNNMENLSVSQAPTNGSTAPLSRRMDNLDNRMENLSASQGISNDIIRGQAKDLKRQVADLKSDFNVLANTVMGETYKLGGLITERHMAIDPLIWSIGDLKASLRYLLPMDNGSPHHSQRPTQSQMSYASGGGFQGHDHHMNGGNMAQRPFQGMTGSHVNNQMNATPSDDPFVVNQQAYHQDAGPPRS